MPRRSVAVTCICAALAACAGSPSGPARREAGNAAVAAASLQPPELVRLRIGDGPVSEPVPHPALGKATLLLALPESFAGQRIELVVDRCDTAGKAEWLRCRPRVPATGPLVFAGLPTGRYLLRAALPVATAGPSIVHGEVEVCGEATIDVAMDLAAAPR